MRENDPDVIAVPFTIARLQFNGAGTNAFPDISTPPGLSICRGARGRDAGRKNGEREREEQPDPSSISTLKQINRWRGSAEAKKGALQHFPSTVINYT